MRQRIFHVAPDAIGPAHTMQVPAQAFKFRGVGKDAWQDREENPDELIVEAKLSVWPRAIEMN